MARTVFIPNTGWHNWENTSHQLEDDNGHFHQVICTTCDMDGIQRNPLGVEVLSSYKKLRREYCVHTPSKVPLVYLRGDEITEFGFRQGQVVEVVPCPLKHKEEHGNEVWVFSKKRNESIMLLHYEYKIV